MQCVFCSNWFLTGVFQMLGTLTAVPIKVPQVSSLHRLAGQAATVLPQVKHLAHLELLPLDDSYWFTLNPD